MKPRQTILRKVLRPLSGDRVQKRVKWFDLDSGTIRNGGKQSFDLFTGNWVDHLKLTKDKS